ncbi:helix-turn-helix domain containing protein [Micromonospora sp. WMMD1102]|uniref:TetR/AcrR family transcriptional regulator n=1 Tax=Micromonospora sp. WMMD1102 TaxID=3016105 RepID=UPI002414D570|nr:TetR/AcrR family transcriptional regulator [Micromonospora sp. WMMD1102]MDG4791467.1 helix-turn-helix domain containing protein [Micromonospora sp. WMMD1102]
MTTADPGRPLRADAQRNRIRILAAAEEVFAEHGVGASTEEVAARAGVAIGTVFRHFPTKNDLLAAIMKGVLAGLVEQAATLSAEDRDGTGLFTFFARTVEQAATKKAVVDLLARTGVDIPLPEVLDVLVEAVHDLLLRARAAGTVDRRVGLPEVMALLASTCQGALHGNWDAELRDRTLAIIFAGLRPGAVAD